MLWDVDYTLVSADGLGTRLYEVVFAEMFGRELTAVAPKAGRTDRAIIADTLALSGVPVSEAGPFLAALTRAAEAGGVPGPVRPLAGAAEAIAALAAAGIRQSVLTGNIRPMAALKLARAGLHDHLDLDAGAYGDAHEVRLGTGHRGPARGEPRSTGLISPAPRRSWSVTRRWTWRRHWSRGPAWWPSRPAVTVRPSWLRRARTWCCPT